MDTEKRSISALLTAASSRIAEASAFGSWPGDERDRQAKVEAEQLICEVAHMTKLQLLMSLQDEAPLELYQAVCELADKRREGQPLAYLLGHTPFYGRVFQTRPDGLIPRPDTEILVDAAVQFIRDYRPTSRVVDVGTGSGCIAISVALACPEVSVVGIDVSDAALRLAMMNATSNEADVTFVSADGIAWLNSDHTDFQPIHVLVSNPPYIPSSDILALDESVRVHEPRLALDGGQDGLDFYRAFADILPDRVFADGYAGVFLEVGDGQALDVANLFRLNDAWRDFTVDTLLDMRGVERVVRVLRI